jgi:hypothetical protein
VATSKKRRRNPAAERLAGALQEIADSDREKILVRLQKMLDSARKRVLGRTRKADRKSAGRKRPGKKKSKR